MTGPVQALLPSVFLGPAVWEPVAALLRAADCDVVVPRHGAAAPRSPDEALAELLAGLPTDRPLVLVPHSNAGLYVPAVSAQREVVRAVHVDALVAPRGVRFAPVSPPAMVGRLAELAARGLLPPWPAWFDPADVTALVSDPAARAAVLGQARRLPLAYVQAQVRVPGDGPPGAYLAFGDTYAADAAEGARRGWPVRHLDGDHLHQVVDPVAVAAAVLDLAGPALPRTPGLG